MESELAGITDPLAAEGMKAYRAIALKPDAIARERPRRTGLEQPEDVDVNKMVLRPTRIM